MYVLLVVSTTMNRKLSGSSFLGAGLNLCVYMYIFSDPVLEQNICSPLLFVERMSKYASFLLKKQNKTILLTPLSQQIIFLNSIISSPCPSSIYTVLMEVVLYLLLNNSPIAVWFVMPAEQFLAHLIPFLNPIFMVLFAVSTHLLPLVP